jgi:hypothetical protein
MFELYRIISLTVLVLLLVTLTLVPMLSSVATVKLIKVSPDQISMSDERR